MNKENGTKIPVLCAVEKDPKQLQPSCTIPNVPRSRCDHPGGGQIIREGYDCQNQGPGGKAKTEKA